MTANPEDHFQDYNEMTVTGPIGHGLRFQWLAINRKIVRALRTPAWDEFTQYSLFSQPSESQPTLEALYPRGEFVLETLRRGAKYYKNVIGLTMYNEGQDEFLYSLRGVWRNIRAASVAGRALGKCLAIVIVDGFAELHKNKPLLDALQHRYKLYSKSVVDRALEVYSKMKKQWESRYKRAVDAKKAEHNAAHGTDPSRVRIHDVETEFKDVAFAFESRLALGTADLYATSESSARTPALDILFIVKAENKKKLHSHLWLFYGFCMLFQPKYVYLIDIGTEPKKKSLLALHDHFEKSEDTGGCCGEIIVKDAPWYDPLVGAQWFEYKIGHIIYKTFESCMGFIPVLPGAFSAYRWEALTADSNHVLKAYLLPFTNPDKLDWTLTNIYFLAEDRIMSEEIVKAKKDHGYVLKFVKEAKALTEGVDELVGLIKQRRRWINGSWFALIKVLRGCSLLTDICSQPHHSCAWKMKFTVQCLYMFIIMLMTWFSVGIFYIGYSMIVKVPATQRLFCSDLRTDSEKNSGENDAYRITQWCGILLYLYIFLMACNVLVALGTAPDNVKPFWTALGWFFGATGVVIVAGSFLIAVQGDWKLNDFVTYEAAGLVLVMAIAVLCYCENFFTLLLFSVYYALLLPTYINILMVFAICKTDDVTWGTRGKDEKGSSLQDEFNWKKTLFLAFFAACNILAGGLVE